MKHKLLLLIAAISATFTSLQVLAQETNALTVSEAINIGMQLDSMATSKDSYMVEGYVIQAGTPNTKYKYQSWYMTDDPNATSSLFQAYCCYPIERSDTVAVQNGYRVQLSGKLQKYYDKNNKRFIVEMTRVKATIISKPQFETITVKEALTIGSKLGDNETTPRTYKIHGYVSAITTPFDTTYKNMTFYVADNANSTAYSNATGGFCVYHGAPSTGASIKEGAEVEFECSIKKYVSNSNVATIENAQAMTVNIIKDGPDCRQLAGTIGDNVFWALNNCEGELTITGSGPTYTYATREEAPFRYRQVNSVVVEEGVSGLGRFLFYGCSMKTVKLPASLDSMSISAFNRCEDFVSFEVDTDNKKYSSKDGVLFNKAQDELYRMPTGRKGAYVVPNNVTKLHYGAFNACYDITAVALPNGLVTIGEAAFYACYSITDIAIPSTVDTIGAVAFMYCDGLANIVNFAAKPQAVDTAVFTGVNKESCTLFVPNASLEAYKAAEGWSAFKHIAAIPQAVEVETGEMQAEPTSNGVVITWPEADDAATYTIEIYKGTEKIYTLTFDASGQLISVEKAKIVRKSQSVNPLPAATQTAKGWQYTLEGLEANTEYTYTVIAKKSDQTVVYDDTIKFTTESGETRINEVSDVNVKPNKLIRNGQLFIQRGNELFNAQGARVK